MGERNLVLFYDESFLSFCSGSGSRHITMLIHPGNMRGMPRVLYYGQCGSINCLVMELLGPNLEDLFQFCGGRFSLKTTLMIAFQILDRIEFLHNAGFIYR